MEAKIKLESHGTEKAKLKITLVVYSNVNNEIYSLY